MAAPRVKRQRTVGSTGLESDSDNYPAPFDINGLKRNEITLGVAWQSYIIPCNASIYKFRGFFISDVLFSGSPDVLYIRGYGNYDDTNFDDTDFYSVNVSTLEMAPCDKDSIDRKLCASDYESCIVGDKKHVISGKYETSVDIYTTDGVYTGMSYLDGRPCWSIACTSNGYIVIGLRYCVAVISSDYGIYISMPRVMSRLKVWCNPVDNTLVIASDRDGNYLLLLPQKSYMPPFPLATLCIATIVESPNIILATLPPIIIKQLLRYINFEINYHRPNFSDN